jgi:large subunit ribosomal protein L23
MKMQESQLAKILQGPVISEKSTLAAEKNHRVVFKVLRNATKPQIKSAVEKMFSVEVESVNVLNVLGKEKRFGKNLGKRSDWKKAYVKLKPGFDIEFSAA